MADEALFDRIEDERPDLDLNDVPESDAPETDATPEVAAAPEPAAPPAPDLQAQLAETLSLHRENLQRQMQAPQQAPPQQPQQPAWVDPFDRPELAQERYVLRQQASYDEEASKKLDQLERQMQDERFQHQLAQQFNQFQQAQRFELQAPTVVQQTFQQLSKLDPRVTQDDYNFVIQKMFGDNLTQAAQVLDPRNPQSADVQQVIADTALGRAFREGRLTPGKPAAAPPAVRSDARNARAPLNEVMDPEYLSETNKQMRAAKMWRK